MQEEIIRVVGVALVGEGPTVLVAQRSAHMKSPLRWEFPGGKVEAGEAPEEALEREIFEEFGCSIEVGNEVGVGRVVHERKQLELRVFWGRIVSGAPNPVEHAQWRWAGATELADFDWAEADIPIVGGVIEGLDAMTESNE